MRDLFLVAIIILGLIPALRYPFAGMLLWVWFTCMQPHREAFGFAQSAPLNLIIAGVTILAWLASKERKAPPADPAVILLFVFLVWMTINSFQAVDPDRSWPLWDRTWKTIVLGLLIGVMATNKVRIHALIWVVVLSLFYYGVKGGLFTIITGGQSHVLGPPNSMIDDNNQLGIAMLMALPLANYLRLNSANVWVRRGLLAGMIVSLVSVLGTYSRGAFVSLGGLMVLAWIRSPRKFVYLAAAAATVVPAFLLMPQKYIDRINTISSPDSDGSVHGRLVAWQVAWRYAVDHVPFGNGFSCSELPQVFDRYFPGEVTHAAHSIYFEVLGDNGFMGLAIYLGILATTLLMYSRIRKHTRGKQELLWAYDLAGMAQLSLIVFCLGGAALSMAYYDLFYILLGLGSALNLAVGSPAGQNARRSKRIGITELAAGRWSGGKLGTASSQPYSTD